MKLKCMLSFKRENNFTNNNNTFISLVITLLVYNYCFVMIKNYIRKISSFLNNKCLTLNGSSRHIYINYIYRL